MTKKGVDIEQVMEEVNRAVAAPETMLAEFWAENRPNAPNLAFIYPPHSKSLQVNLDLVSRNWEIDGDFEIGSRRKFVGGIISAFKKMVKRATSWYINPIVHQVRKFNMLVTRTLYDFNNNLEELESRVARLEELQGGGRTKEADGKLSEGEGEK
ncbi:MAG: hypothetical protein JXA49_01290 [Actinobacteria bacterium]|nr:hypothetical protein [Actinomycetota bacterium]